MRILLGSWDGTIRAQVDKGNISNIEWRLNKAGSATLFVRRDDNSFREDLLLPGTRIYVELDNGLPAWGGVLDLPRKWHENTLEIKAHTIERLLKFLITVKTLYFYGVPVGSIFADVVSVASNKAGLRISMGQIWYGGNSHWTAYHLRDAMWIINKSIRKMETCDYSFTPYLSNGKIRFRASLQQQIGNDKRDSILLVKGSNITDATLTEQGDIVNKVAVVGSGNTWTEKSVSYGIERTSQRKFGLREDVLTPQDVSQSATLNRYADTAIRENAYPHTLADLMVADVKPALFAEYGVGDIVQVRLPNYGFHGYDAPMRIIARGYDPKSGECKLVCDERFAYIPMMRGDDDILPYSEE